MPRRDQMLMIAHKRSAMWSTMPMLKTLWSMALKFFIWRCAWRSRSVSWATITYPSFRRVYTIVSNKRNEHRNIMPQAFVHSTLCIAVNLIAGPSCRLGRISSAAMSAFPGSVCLPLSPPRLRSPRPPHSFRNPYIAHELQYQMLSQARCVIGLARI